MDTAQMKHCDSNSSVDVFKRPEAENYYKIKLKKQNSGEEICDMW